MSTNRQIHRDVDVTVHVLWLWKFHFYCLQRDCETGISLLNEYIESMAEDNIRFS